MVRNCESTDDEVPLPLSFLGHTPFAADLCAGAAPSPPFSPLSQLTDRTDLDSPDVALPLARLHSPSVDHASLSLAVVECVRSLVADGDAYWAATSRRVRPSAPSSRTSTAVHEIVSSLSEAGLITDVVAVAATMYMRRLSRLDVKLVSRFTIRRYLLAAFVIANKMCSDTYYPLRLYAAACRTAKEVIGSSEFAVLSYLDFRVMVPPVADSEFCNEFDQTYALLLDLAQQTPVRTT